VTASQLVTKREKSPPAATGGLALGLGIGDLIQKNNKKVFATLGIVLSSVTILGTILLVIVGLAIG